MHMSTKSLTVVGRKAEAAALHHASDPTRALSKQGHGDACFVEGACAGDGYAGDGGGGAFQIHGRVR